MNALYLAVALNLDTPVVDAIFQALPSTQAFRRAVAFFAENGFSLVRIAHNATEIQATFAFDDDMAVLMSASFQASTFQFWKRSHDLEILLIVGKKSNLFIRINGNAVSDHGIPEEMLTTLFFNRILELLYPYK